jgi:hypothetical protein
MDPATSRDISLRVAGARRDDTYVGPACPRVRPKELGDSGVCASSLPARSYVVSFSFQMTTMSAAADGGRQGEEGKKYGMVSCAPKGHKWPPSGSISPNNRSRDAPGFLGGCCELPGASVHALHRCVSACRLSLESDVCVRKTGGSN